MARSALSLAVVVCLTLTAAADIPPPPPERGFKRVPYEFVLMTDGELKGYKFYPFSRLGLGGQEKIGEELKPSKDKGVSVPSSSSPSVRTGVVAVPDKVMDELKTKENLAKLLSEKSAEKLPAGVVIYETRGTIRDLKESDPRKKVENVLTVSSDEKAGVKFTSKETPEPERNDTDSSLSKGMPFAPLIAGIAGALAIVTLGVWLFRRKSI